MKRKSTAHLNAEPMAVSKFQTALGLLASLAGSISHELLKGYRPKRMTLTM